MTTRHTPGQWRARPMSNEEGRTIRDTGAVIDAGAYDPVTDRGEYVGTVTHGERAEANAALIAAAPELLAVLKRIAVGVDGGHIRVDWALGMMISDAIAKAEGGGR